MSLCEVNKKHKQVQYVHSIKLKRYVTHVGELTFQTCSHVYIYVSFLFISSRGRTTTDGGFHFTVLESVHVGQCVQLVTCLSLCDRRKTQATMRPALDSSALSSDDDDDSLYDPSTITSILTESNLQTSSC